MSYLRFYQIFGNLIFPNLLFVLMVFANRFNELKTWVLANKNWIARTNFLDFANFLIQNIIKNTPSMMRVPSHPKRNKIRLKWSFWGLIQSVGWSLTIKPYIFPEIKNQVFKIDNARRRNTFKLDFLKKSKMIESRFSNENFMFLIKISV